MSIEILVANIEIYASIEAEYTIEVDSQDPNGSCNLILVLSH